MKTISNMKKVVILGCAGCGKSTLAATLGSLLNIRVVHLDTIYWKPNWVEQEKEIFVSKQKEILKEDAWIMDGNYRDTLEMRLEECDTIIYLDYPRHTALYGIYKRYFEYHNKTRESITPGCREKIDRGFFKWVWNFKKSAKPLIIEKINKVKEQKNVLFFKKRKELNQFLNKLKEELITNDN